VATEFVDRGVSGAKDRRPALDAMLKEAKRRRFDVLVCWRLDRLGRSLKHLVGLAAELTALGIAFVSLGEGIDCTSPAGKLQLHILAALAEFERERNRERVVAGVSAGESTRQAAWTTEKLPDNGRHSGRHGESSSQGVGCVEEHGREADKRRTLIEPCRLHRTNHYVSLRISDDVRASPRRQIRISLTQPAQPHIDCSRQPVCFQRCASSRGVRMPRHVVTLSVSASAL
jgi:hypothetical protein